MRDPASILSTLAAALAELDSYLAGIDLPDTAFQIRPGEWVASPPAFVAGIRSDLLSPSPRAREAAAERLSRLLAAGVVRGGQHTPQQR
jgi:hypothetical protein